MRLTKAHKQLLESRFHPGPEEYSGVRQRSEIDFVWVDLQPFLKKQGYELRPRFQPVWQPSWLAGGSLAGEHWSHCEDNLALSLYWGALDAIRIKGGQRVVLKIVLDDTDELKLLDHFSKPPLRDDPRNHCVRVLDVIPVDGRRFKIMVLPFLTHWHSSPVHCMSEVIDSIRQTLEGLEFLHDHNIAHKDISRLNIMMDGTKVVPSGCHFSDPFRYALKSGLLVLTKPKPRCHVGPVRYFFIDLGFSRHYPEGKDKAQTNDRVGQTEVTPEMSLKGPFNPFMADVFQLGLVFKDLFPLQFPHLNDFNSLFDKMTATKPADRPTAAQALLLFEEIVSSMSEIRRWYKQPTPTQLFVERYLSRVLLSLLLAVLIFIFLRYGMISRS
ncbi:kinase-like domain-containing protein [Mycena floridula]|nr:kinase-like domain-containing protein [Mycena floridula]